MLPRFLMPREDSAGDALAAMSIGMSVAMAKALGKSGKGALHQNKPFFLWHIVDILTMLQTRSSTFPWQIH